MNCTQLATNLLAQYSRWERLGDGLHRSRGRLDLMEVLPYLIGLLVLGAVVAAVLAYFKYNDLSKPCNDPNRLFRELCRAHGLDRASQKLLWQLASLTKLPQPAEVFLTPAVFEANQLPEQLCAEQERVRELRERLF
ncbi:MAG: hypothetical protein GXP28_09350 [Planctomycetes bacterium]|nr:hypothetical protein [Planctomycetota bacterium]